jgi:hypothetical protein
VANFIERSGIDIRSDFNKIVGDLNDKKEEKNQIKYLSDVNELQPGFINSIRVFEKILGLKLPSLEEATSQEEWVTSSFETIFTTLNPTRTYEIDLQDLKEKDKDVFGTLKVSVFKEEKLLFSFVEKHSPDHAFINNIWDEKQEAAKKSKSAFNEEKLEKVKTQDTAETFWLLAPTELQEKHVYTPLYKLFSAPMQDNDKRINFLTHLQDLPKTNTMFIQKNTPALQSMLSHVLESIGWEDQNVCEKASPLVQDLVENDAFKDFHNILYTGVRNFDLKKNFALLKNFKNLTKLSVGPNDDSESYDDSESHDDSDFTSISPEGLKPFENLEEVSIGAVKNLNELTFFATHKKITIIILDSCTFEKVEGIHLLPNLKTLNLMDVPKLKKITFSAINKELKEINFSDTVFEEIDGLDQLPNLRKIYINNEPIKKVKFSKINKNLKKVDLSGSGVKEVYIPCTPQKGTLTVDVSDTNQLEKLTLKHGIKLTGIKGDDKRIHWLEE